MDADRLLPAHRDPEEFPAAALLDPVAVIVRHDDKHGVAGLQPVAAALVLQVAGAGDGVLQHGERRLAAPPAVPVVGRAGPDLVAGAGRHGVQPMTAARQRNGLHDRRTRWPSSRCTSLLISISPALPWRAGRNSGKKVRQLAKHKITQRSTKILCSRQASLLILGQIEREAEGRQFHPRRPEDKPGRQPATSDAGNSDSGFKRCGRERERQAHVTGIRIAIIGAGSVGFTKKLFTDIVSVSRSFATPSLR